MGTGRVAILHYTAPPVVGGVEAVILAHTGLMLEAGFDVTLVAGSGAGSALPPEAKLALIPEMDSRRPAVAAASASLEAGRLPDSFEPLARQLTDALGEILRETDTIILHNLLSKHFNLPLTAAIVRLLESGALKRCIAWCHDLTWTSSHSQSKVYPGYPWDLLRTPQPKVIYVAVSRQRQRELAELFGIPPECIQVVYNGVEPQTLFGLTPAGTALIGRLNLWESDLILLMPVRVTQAKNIELALQVAAILKARRLRPRLIVTGPPDPHDAGNMAYYQSLLDLRRQLQVENELRFVYESGPEAGQPLILDSQAVAELYRVSDALFMPSRREGFGMPVLEAGLLGLPVICAHMPAADEIGGGEVMAYPPESSPEEVAARILAWAEASPTHRLRQRVRRNYTWEAIFRREMIPLLAGNWAE